MILGLAQSNLHKELIDRIESYARPECPGHKVWESHPEAFWMVRSNFKVSEALDLDRFVQAREHQALTPTRLGYHKMWQYYLRIIPIFPRVYQRQSLECPFNELLFGPLYETYFSDR